MEDNSNMTESFDIQNTDSKSSKEAVDKVVQQIKEPLEFDGSEEKKEPVVTITDLKEKREKPESSKDDTSSDANEEVASVNENLVVEKPVHWCSAFNGFRRFMEFSLH